MSNWFPKELITAAKQDGAKGFETCIVTYKDGEDGINTRMSYRCSCVGCTKTLIACLRDTIIQLETELTATAIH